ncbi:MAG: phosphodiester glycosidase family protein [Nanoarchaeota archaeon]|nr:phosphodiester glycosidase family protein [Nanoarchaeota archaeon]
MREYNYCYSLKMQIDINHFLNDIKKEEIKTWFDIGLFLDRLKDNNKNIKQFKSYEEFKEYIAKGTAFINYYLSIDGVTIENIKYSIVLKKLFPGIKIHWIQDHINPKQTHFNGPDIIKHNIKGLDGFEKWPPYMKLFHTNLKRGSKAYNELITTIWDQTLSIIKELLKYFKKNNITNIFVTNVASNPGNFALTLAVIIISEKLGMPVLNSNHDFYWEGGAPRSKRKKRGSRDHFFRNYDIGEVFSLQEQIYPWVSDKWMHLNINILQTKRLIKKIGINPNNTDEITTSIESEIYRNISTKEKTAITKKLNRMFNKNTYRCVFNNNRDLFVESKEALPVIFGIDKKYSKGIFSQDNVLFLQPTRILKRKRIEKDILLVKKMISSKKIISHLKENKKINIILLISGPISAGNLGYFEYILREIRKLYTEHKTWVIKRLFVAFSFGTIKNKAFDVDLKSSDLTISETYEASDFALLPSETEGRGLPLLEAAAAHTGIIASRYYPITVFKRVIGEHLPRTKRINIIEFPEGTITKEFTERIVQYLLDKGILTDVIKHNRRVIEKRFHYDNLVKDFEKAYYALWCSASKDPKNLAVVKKALRMYFKSKKSVPQDIVYAVNRKYIPGYWYLQFMHYLRSLIDPSYFRIEEAELKGRLYFFCTKCMENKPAKKKVFFYECMGELFTYYDKKDDIVFDHSFAFRHRNNLNYPYKRLTEQELMGVICIMMGNVFGRKFDPYKHIREKVESTILLMLSKFKGDWKNLLNSMAVQFSIDRELRYRRLKKHSFDKQFEYSVDNRSRFIEDVLKKPTHLIHFPGGLGELIIEMNVLGEELLKEWSKRKEKGFSVTFAAKEERYGNETTVSDIKRLLPKFPLLLKYYKKGVFKIIPTGSKSFGVNFEQASKKLIKTLKKAKNKGGVITAKGSHNFFTLDCIDLPSYRFGVTEEVLASKLNGFARKKAYFQFVPAGFRTSYAYPVPFYRAHKMASLLTSDKYKSIVRKFNNNENKVLKLLKENMDKYGFPLTEAIERMFSHKANDAIASYTTINGLYKDGYPYNGVLALVDIPSLKVQGRKFAFELVGNEAKTEKVTVLAKKMQRRTGKNVDIAWNGGYILNPELIGKLGLPERYIGTPMGLIIKKNKVKSLPLYNKPVFAVTKQGSVIIKRTKLDFGCSIKIKNKKSPSIEWTKDMINNENNKGDIIIYDLLCDQQVINAKGRVILQLAGDRIAKIHKTGNPYTVLPLGPIISIKKQLFDKVYKKYYKEGCLLEFRIKDDRYKDITTAIEAGPLLIKEGKIAIDMEEEGWTTQNSIRTQANRLDYTNLRGPKIGVGITKEGKLLAIAINGRIRESVGSTYHDIARILLKHNAYFAMGFDPGGSATLMLKGKQINISPYNSKFNEHPYTAKAEERKVANAVLGYRA